MLIFFGAQGQNQRTYTFNTGGTYQWTVPCDVTQITIEAWGAGAAGTNANGGGGGGAYARKDLTGLIPGTVYNLQVGAGGTNPGSPAGGNTVFGSNLVLAEGGGRNGNWSLGGRASASIGDVRFSGGNGGQRNGNGGGGGGSSASDTRVGENGGNGSGNTGGTGGQLFGAGNGGEGGKGSSGFFGSGGDGKPGGSPGGGGGQNGWGNWSDGDMGRGGDGQIKISYQGISFYCEVGVGNNVEPITLVNYAGINNSTSTQVNGSNPEYENFCLTANVVKGQSNTLTVKGNTNGNRTDHFTAFIDWNQDGDFDDSNEKINIGTITNSNGGSSATSISVNIPVPTFALVGKTKMRIIKNRNSYPGSGCHSPQNGQIEDYVVNVQDQNATISSYAPTSGCVGAIITINGTNFSNATEVKFNGVDAAFTVLSASQITATVPVGASTGKISVVTPSNTATSSGNFTVNATTQVTNVSGEGTHCESAQLTATGTGTIYFQGTNPGGESTTLGGATVTVTSSGTYYFRSFNGSCWSPAQSVDVTIDQTPAAVTVSSPSSSCGPAIIIASGGSGYQIYFQGTTPGGESIVEPVNSKTITSSGTYYFRAKSECGWGQEGYISITINPLPAAVTVSASQTQFCSSTGTVLTASGGSGGTIYFQGTNPGGTSTAQPLNSITVNTSGTYYFRSRSSAGCWGAEGSVTVVQQAGFSITNQPQSEAICVGQNVTFNVGVSPTTGVTYQWYKEGIEIVGATSSSYTISNAQLTDASYDYYCLISDACGSATTNHVSLTVNNSVTAPTSQPSNLQFVTGATSIGGTFTTTTASGYLVVRTNSPSAPSAPVDGTSYTAGLNALGGIIEYSGPDNLFSSTGLTQGTTYYYWIFAYNVGVGGCGNSPDYLNANPLAGNATTSLTATCSQITTLYWAGSGSVLRGTSSDNFNLAANWSLNQGSYQPSPLPPTECTNVILNLRTENNFYWLGEDKNNPAVKLYGSAKVHNLTLNSLEGQQYVWFIIWLGPFPISSNVSLNTNGNLFEVYGNANISINYNENTVRIGDFNGANGGTLDFKADVTIGNNNFNDGEATFIGGSTTKAIFRGGLTFGKLGGVDETNPIDAVFDGTATSLVTWNNTVNNARFRNVTIGQANSPTVTHGGSQLPSNILGNLTMNNSSTLSLVKQWNRHSNGGALNMNNTSRLLLYADNSQTNGGSATLIGGSNFPSGFSNISLTSGSTVSYSGGIAITQKIYSSPTYGAIILKNSNSSGIANKINDAPTKHAGTLTVEGNTRFTLGANITNNGNVNILSNGILLMNNFLKTGGGTFTLNSGATLGIGSTAGITSIGATGNVQNTGGRTFNNDAQYLYNGTAHQVTGSGLPSQQRSLEIDNNSNVELTNDAEPVQLLKLTSGNLEIKNHTLTLNNVAYPSGRLAGSDVSNITVKGNGVGLYFNPVNKGNALKELNFDSNATAQLSATTGDTLNITAGLAPGQAGHLKLNSNSQITTNGNLTLKSNKFGTASIAKIEGSGATLGKIIGDVTVERYINVGNGNGQHKKKWLFLATPTGWDGNGQTIRQSFMENKNSIPGFGIQLTSPSGSDWDGTSYSPSIKYYNTTSGQYVGAGNATDDLYNHSGWMVFVRGDRTVTGIQQTPTNTTLRSKGHVATGQQQFTIPAQANGFASFGNPYASTIDMRNVTWPGADQFYVWDPNLGGDYGYGAYHTYTDNGNGVYVEIPGSGDTNNLIQSGQAFFIQTESASGTITFNESSKEGSSNSTQFFRPGKTQGRISSLRTNLYSGETLVDGTLQFFNDQFSNAIDMRDGRKMMNSGANLSIKVDNKLLIVERRETVQRNDTIFFNLTGAGNGKYNFKLDAKNLSAPGLEAWLEDAFTQQRTPINLEGNTSVQFEITGVAASKAANRFRIVFKPAAPLPVTFIKVDALHEGGQVNVLWTVANEVGVQEYVVMKSTDGTNFSDMSTLPASGISKYATKDVNAINGYNYYRIRSVDRDGKESYSTIAKVWIGYAQPLITVFPNPVANGVINLKLENMPKGKYTVRLMNPGGQLILMETFDHAGGNYTEKIPWDYKMAHGHYKLEVKQPDGGVRVITVMY